MHISTMGQGPDLVLLHGWSMHSAVWHQLAEHLAQSYTLHLVDLPGHGYSEWQTGDFELEHLTQQLAQQLPQHAHYLAWSLGGLVAMTLAHHFPGSVNKLILMAATPCFVKHSVWPNAMDAEVFQDFANNLQQDQQQTLQRFLMLQARGSTQSKATIRQLSEQLAKETPAQADALQAGLATLINTDARVIFSALNCPVKVILGQRDTLIPAAVADDYLSLKSATDITMIEGAGHAPFISHVELCQTAIEQFLNDD